MEIYIYYKSAATCWAHVLVLSELNKSIINKEKSYIYFFHFQTVMDFNINAISIFDFIKQNTF